MQARSASFWRVLSLSFIALSAMAENFPSRTLAGTFHLPVK